MIPLGLNILVNIVFSSSPILCWPLWPIFFCCFLNITYILLFPFLVDLFMVILYLYSFGSWVKVIYSYMKILSKGPQMWEKMRSLSFYVLLLPTFFFQFHPCTRNFSNSFCLQRNSIPLCICTSFSLYIHQLKGILVVSIPSLLCIEQ